MRNEFKAWFVGLSFGWLLVLTGCQRPMSVDQDVNNLHRATGTQIIAFGDSITAGAGVRIEEAYPSVLSQILDLPILNRGRGGDTTATALNRLQQDVIQADPWLVIVGLGGNDYLLQVPLAKTEQNLRQIVTRLQQAGAIVVVLEMSVEPFNGDYEKLYQRVANDTQAYLIPQVLEGLNDPLYLYDEIHPNQAGHRVMAKRIAEGLKPLLDEASLPPNLSKAATK
jgi:acyl-CoA thioesterase-1